MSSSSSVIFLDAEMTSNDDVGELLELSIIDAEGHILFNHLFRPTTVRWWRTDIHHITRSMVRHERPVVHYRQRLDKILAGARYVVGCGLHNDLAQLLKSGLAPVPPERCIELQQWFWLLHDQSDRTAYQETSLARIAETYGLSVSDSDAHRSLYDTRLTLAAFRALAADTVARRLVPDDIADHPDLLAGAFQALHSDAHRLFWQNHARGFMELRPALHGSFTAIFRATPPSPELLAANPSRIFLPLSDRFSAQWQLAQEFHPRVLSSSIQISRIPRSRIPRLKSFNLPFDYDRSISAYNNLRHLRSTHRQKSESSN